MNIIHQSQISRHSKITMQYLLLFSHSYTIFNVTACPECHRNLTLSWDSFTFEIEALPEFTFLSFIDKEKFAQLVNVM